MKIRVLCVDDDLNFCKIITEILTDAGLLVLAAPNGAKALEIINQVPNFYDVLMVDYAMPEMSGITLIKEVLKIPNSLKKIILYSAMPASELQLDFMRPFKHIVYAPKDLTPEKLLQLINYLDNEI